MTDLELHIAQRGVGDPHTGAAAYPHAIQKHLIGAGVHQDLELAAATNDHFYFAGPAAPRCTI